MSVSVSYLREHGAMLGALARLVVAGAVPKRQGQRTGSPAVPGEHRQAVVAPLPDALIDDFIRFVGGNPQAYAGVVPATLYPQWAMALAAKNLMALPYPFLRILNAGTTIYVHEMLPRGQPLHVSAQLVSVDADDRRVLITQEVVTGTASTPRAVVASFQTLLPKRRPAASGSSAKRDSSGNISYSAEPVFSHDFSATAGRDFALLTGDINPVHWVPPYARAMGFSGPILHGFATAALAAEGLVHSVCAGDPARLQRLEVRFTRPLALPACATVYLAESGSMSVGLAKGARAVATGRYELRDPAAAAGLPGIAARSA